MPAWAGSRPARRSGIADDTYVIFTSDNGGEISGGVTNNSPAGQGQDARLGRRHPGTLFIRGPGIAAGSESHVPAIGFDFFATIADWVGASIPLPDDQDGGSLRGVLTNGGVGTVERGTGALIWYYGAYRNGKHVLPKRPCERTTTSWFGSWIPSEPTCSTWTEISAKPTTCHASAPRSLRRCSAN